MLRLLARRPMPAGGRFVSPLHRGLLDVFNAPAPLLPSRIKIDRRAANVQAFIRRASRMADKTSWTKPLAPMVYGDSIVGTARLGAGAVGGGDGWRAGRPPGGGVSAVRDGAHGAHAGWPGRTRATTRQTPAPPRRAGASGKRGGRLGRGLTRCPSSLARAAGRRDGAGRPVDSADSARGQCRRRAA